MNARTPHRDAIRILFILNAGGMPLADPNDPTVAKIFKGEARLHAFDFWIRTLIILQANCWTATQRQAMLLTAKPRKQSLKVMSLTYGAFR